MDKLVLIDGNSLVNRAFYALPPLNNPQGVQVQAVYGFAAMLVKAIETLHPDYIVTAFDMHAPTFRHKLYDGYKAKRKGMPEELAAQMPILKDMLDTMGIRRVESEGYEADDLIGTLAKRFDTQTYIVTGDRDSLQLVDAHTRVWLTKRGISEIVEITHENIEKEFGVSPRGVIEYKSLAGDASDEIPGVPGIGDKTAKQLLASYGDLDGIYAHIDEVSPAVAAKLKAGRESAYLSQRLAVIDTAVPLDCTLESCTYNFPFGGKVFAFFERQKFKSLMRRSELFSAGGAVASPEALTASRVVVDTAEALRARIEGKQQIAVAKTADGFAVAVEEGVEVCVPLCYDLLGGGLREAEAIEVLRPVLTDDGVEKIFFDSKNACKQVRALCGKDIENVFDVKLAQYIVDSVVPHETLAELAEAHGFSAGQDAATLLCLRRELDDALKDENMAHLYYDIELPLVRVLTDMERWGIAVDRARLEQIGASYDAQAAETRDAVYAEAGREFNINSPKQLAQVLFDEMKIPYPTKSNKHGTSAEILEQIDPSYTIVPLVQRYRFLAKLRATYIDGLRKVLDKDNVVHTEYRQTLTRTGRLSSVEPNLQNIPVREEEGKILRSLFVAREGFTLVSADYSQIELRLMAHFSADPQMINAYRNGADIHAFTASQIFDVPQSEVTAHMRRAAKSVNFGIIYGIGDFGLASQLHISRAQAKKYIDEYFARFSGVRAYLDRSVAEAKEKGYVGTLFGRRRKIPELFSSIYTTRQFGERAAMNMPLQGTAADIIKIAMLAVSRALAPMRSRLLLQVHDELIVEAADEELEEVKLLLRREMENCVKLDVPLTVSVSCGKSWFDCK